MKHTVGTIVESICGKCNDVMGHTIVSMIGGTIAKVECRICGSVHRYRPPSRTASGTPVTMKRGRDGTPTTSRQSSTSPTARPTTTGKTSRKPDPASLERERWVSMSQKRQNENTRAYAMTETFTAQELLNHPLFGLGEVLTVIAPDKMDVLFQDGIKRLLHNKR